MRRDHRKLAVVAVLVLAACTVDQDAEVAQYREVLDANVPAPPPFVEDATLSLRTAMALANRNNEALAAGGEQYVQALIERRRAAAGFAPTIVFAPNFAVADRPGGLLPVPSGYRADGAVVRRLEIPVQGSWNLLRGGGDLAALRATEAYVTQRRALLVDLQASLLQDVAQAFYAVLRAERSAEVLRTALATQDARVVDVERRLRNGLGTALAVAQTRAQREATRGELASVEGEIVRDRSALALLLGVRDVRGELLVDFDVPTTRSELAACEAEAEGAREDLRAADAGVGVARQRVEAAFAQYYPAIGLDLTGFLHREDFADASHWSALLTLSLPLFDAGRIQADVREAWSQWREALLEQSASRRRVRRDVQYAHSDLGTADRRILSLQDEVTAAEHADRLAQVAFTNGLATNLDVLTAQDLAVSARLSLAVARFDQAVAYLDLVRATGGIQRFAAAD